MYVVTVTFTVIEKYFEQFLKTTEKQARDSLTLETGCTHFDVCSSEDGTPTLFLYEIYSDKSAFEAHLKSRHFQHFNTQVSDWTETKLVQTWGLRKDS